MMTTNTHLSEANLVAQALTYAGRGWRVLPVNGKVPSLKIGPPSRRPTGPLSASGGRNTLTRMSVSQPDTYLGSSSWMLIQYTAAMTRFVRSKPNTGPYLAPSK